MGCPDASHSHQWNITGTLVVQRCEIRCNFCDGPAAQKDWKYAWFLRRHIRAVHVAKGAYPDLIVSDCWDADENGVLRKQKQRRKPKDKTQTKQATRSDFGTLTANDYFANGISGQKSLPDFITLGNQPQSFGAGNTSFESSNGFAGLDAQPDFATFGEQQQPIQGINDPILEAFKQLVGQQQPICDAFQDPQSVIGLAPCVNAVDDVQSIEFAFFNALDSVPNTAIDTNTAPGNESATMGDTENDQNWLNHTIDNTITGEDAIVQSIETTTNPRSSLGAVAKPRLTIDTSEAALDGSPKQRHIEAHANKSPMLEIETMFGMDFISPLPPLFGMDRLNLDFLIKADVDPTSETQAINNTEPVLIDVDRFLKSDASIDLSDRPFIETFDLAYPLTPAEVMSMVGMRDETVAQLKAQGMDIKKMIYCLETFARGLTEQIQVPDDIFEKISLGVAINKAALDKVEKQPFAELGLAI